MPALCAMLTQAMLALYNMNLETNAGEEVFAGGAQAANCQACFAVVEDVEAAMRKPFEKVDVGKDSSAERARRHRLNRELYAQQVLDPNRCRRSMPEYDLSYTQGANRFIREASSKMLP
eukprot:6487986-Prymnesium_polylepis.1